MTKQEVKIYLEPRDLERLLAKARGGGFEGRGMLSHFLTFLSDKILLIITDEQLNELKQKQHGKQSKKE